MTPRSQSALTLALSLLLPVAMTACTGQSETAANATIHLDNPGPAAETVNGEEVPERLLVAYARMRNLDLSRPDQRQRALKDLANIVITAQAARDAKLYEDAEFTATAEMMRLQSLATASAAQFQRAGTIDDTALRAEYDKMTQANGGTDPFASAMNSSENPNVGANDGSGTQGEKPTEAQQILADQQKATGVKLVSVTASK